MNDLQWLAVSLVSGNRRSLARAITLVESQNPDHREQADSLIAKLAETDIRQAVRVGLTGAPGVGKSSLIETLGTHLTQQGLRVAVLAVDPSSARTGGSILGDKTRMENLSRDPLAYIRPSPSNLVLGGVAAHTREVIFLCEQAGFDVVFVETTGVGQSETIVSELTDIFVLLVSPAGGDELQGVKRGIMEMADLVAVTKSDGELREAAERTRAEYAAALRLFSRRDCDPEEFPAAVLLSIQKNRLVEQLWEKIETIEKWRRRNGAWDRSRQQQEIHWIKSRFRRHLVEVIENDPGVIDAFRRLEDTVASGGSAFSKDARDELRRVGRSFARGVAGRTD